MYLGIDVGGTFTDAVIIDNGHIICWAKSSTRKDDLLGSLLETLDKILPLVDPVQIKRVTLSTTIVTNMVVEGREDSVDLYVIPGPGMNLTGCFPKEAIYVKGYIDHRGMLVEPVGEIRIPQEKAHSFFEKGRKVTLAAVSAKFSVRNPKEEIRVSQYLKEKGYDVVSEGAYLSGALNFIRRTNSAYYNSAVKQGFMQFKEAVEGALRKRGILSPLFILKADGGSLPMDIMLSRPVETIFTGPAASVLGMEALVSMSNKMTVAIDIGGTTSDISLWKEGKPLPARGGIYIKDHPSAVRSFQVHSVGIGGDSYVRFERDTLKVGPERIGPAMALGGEYPTLGDALITLGLCRYGDFEKAQQAMRMLAKGGSSVTNMAEEVVKQALLTIIAGINQTIETENKKPIYVVSDIVHSQPFKAEELILVGGTAHAMAPLLEEYLCIPCRVPEAAAVANAVGAAVAKESLLITVRVDTRRKILTVAQMGYEEPYVWEPTIEKVVERGREILAKIIYEKQWEEQFEVEVVDKEEFSVLDDRYNEDKIVTVFLQIKAGVREYVS